MEEHLSSTLSTLDSNVSLRKLQSQLFHKIDGDKKQLVPFLVVLERGFLSHWGYHETTETTSCWISRCGKLNLHPRKWDIQGRYILHHCFRESPSHLQTFVAAMSIHGSKSTTSFGGRSHVKQHTVPKTRGESLIYGGHINRYIGAKSV